MSNTKAADGRGTGTVTDTTIEGEPVGAISPFIREVLERLGEDPGREGLVKTPARVEAALRFLTRGYGETPAAVVGDALFEAEHQSMIMVRDIELYSMCEHHMLPFFGRCHIAYIPRGKVFGVSKLARIVDRFARRLQLQERLTEQISQVVMDEIGAAGVGVMVEAKHLCMMMRGVQKQNSATTTSAFDGEFLDNHVTRNEFLKLIASNLD